MARWQMISSQRASIRKCSNERFHMEWQWLWSFSSGRGAGGKCLFRLHLSVLCVIISFFSIYNHPFSTERLNSDIQWPQWTQSLYFSHLFSNDLLWKSITAPSSDTRPTEKIMIIQAFSCPFVSQQLSTYLFSHIFCNKNYRHKKGRHFYPNFPFFVSL